MNGAGHLLVLLFWACTAGVVYTYAVYPGLIYLLARASGRRRTAPSSIASAELPWISVLIAAHNEEAVIEARIRNILAMDYPSERREIVIASDGSTDRTAEIVRQFAGEGIRLLDFSRRGKAAVLNGAFPQLQGDIVLLSDANTYMAPDAARRLIRWFDEPAAGVVCGRLVLRDHSSGTNVDGLYWKYETFLKKQEGRLGALLGSNGAIYAIRRELLCPIPPNIIVDDFVIPLLAKLRSGCQIIYDAEAVAYEEIAPDVKGEFRRRSRIGAGGWQAIAMLWPLLHPKQGWIAFTFASHKILRWVCPMLLVAALLSSVALWRVDFYRMIVAVEGILAAIAVLGGYVPPRFPGGRVLRLANMFLLMNAALGVGFIRWLATPQTGIWARTQRSGERPDAMPSGPAGASEARPKPQKVNEAVRVTP